MKVDGRKYGNYIQEPLLCVSCTEVVVDEINALNGLEKLINFIACELDLLAVSLGISIGEP